jgi:hypothetical protein
MTAAHYPQFRMKILHLVGRIIMATKPIDPLTAKTLETQRDVFRLAEFDHGLTRKVIADKSGLNYDTLGTYARGQSPLPVPALVRLCDVLPDHLLSRLLDPAGRCITKNEDADPIELIERGLSQLKQNGVGA